MLHWNGNNWTDTVTGSPHDIHAVWGSGSSNVFAVVGSTVLHYNGSAWSSMASGTGFALNSVWGSSSNNVVAVGGQGTIRYYNGSSWTGMTSGTLKELYAVWGSSSADIFAVGYKGVILHYDGSAWSTMSSGGAIALMDVWGSGPNDVFAVGEGTILHYNGITWSAMSCGTTKGISDIWGFSSDNVFAVGNNGLILHYDGTYWATMSSGTSKGLTGIWGSGPNDIYAVGDNSVFHFNGSNWSIVDTGISIYPIDVWGSGPDDVFIVGCLGTIIHYNGNTWTLMRKEGGDQISGIWGSGANDVYAVGQNGTILHYNGSSWTQISSGTTDWFVGIGGSSANNVFVVGYNGRILHYDGSKWNAMSSGTTNPLYGVWSSSSGETFVVGVYSTILRYSSCYWNAMNSGTTSALYDIWGSSTNDIFAVGYQGIIVRYNGSAWSFMNSGTTNSLSEIWGSGANDVFAVGEKGTILHYDGSNWNAMNSGTENDLISVWGSSPNDIFVTGENGTILHYNGSIWTTMNSSTTNGLSIVWGSGPDNVFVVGDYGTILHYNGSTWTAMSSGVINHLNGVWGSGPNDVFVVGSLGIILHFNGTTWTTMESGTANTLIVVWGTGPGNVFAVGYGGTIVHYNGISWTNMNSGTQNSLYSIWGSGSGNVYAVGKNGTILHYSIPLPEADFTASTTTFTAAPYTVNFTDTSTGSPTSWAWDFNNDGTVDSTAQNPSYTYTAPGNYSVKLLVTNTYGSAYEVKTNYIKVYAPPTASFSGTPTIGTTGVLLVNFTDASAGNIVSWAWDFYNNGSVDSTEQNPSYNFPVGNHSIKLTVTNPAGTDEEIKNNYIKAYAPPEASFYINPTTSNTGSLTVNFTDWSRGNIVSWAWDFDNDGTVDSSAQNPSYTYTTPGNYSVKLTVTNPAGSDDEIRTNGIKIYSTPVADFTSNITSGPAPLTVNFTDASTGNITGWSWDFNYDGVSDSTVQNPSYTYSIPGNYVVKLTVTNPSGTDEEIKPNYIKVYSAPVADFSVNVISGNAPLTVNFTDLSSGSPTSWSWDFNNDGTVDSTAQNPSYTYSNPGNYTVKLTVTNNFGTDLEIKTDYIKVYAPPMALFTSNVTSGYAPLTVNFTDASTGNIVSRAWDFNNDGITDSTAQNPSYTYTVPGTYAVKLTVTNPAGTDDEVKIAFISVTTIIEVGSALIGQEISAAVPITVKGFGYEAGLGAYEVKIEFNSSVIRIDSVTGGIAPFDITPTAGPAGFPGYVTIVATQTAATPGPTGDFVIAHLNVTAIGNPGDSTTLKVTVERLTLTSGGEVQGTSSDGTVTITKADFSATPLAGAAPLQVQFTDLSTASPSSWAWDFNNDGTVDSTIKNPVYTYTSGGTYTVKLTITYSPLTLSITKTDYINVIKADFSADKTVGKSPLTVSFTNTSTGPITSRAWDFNNDGTVDSTAQNPSYTYTATGTYTVKLRVSNTSLGISGEEVKTGYINVINYRAVTSLQQYQDPVSKVIYLNVNITGFKNPATGEPVTLPGGIGAYEATTTFDSSGIQVTNVVGVAPFDAPVTNLGQTNKATLNSYQAGSEPQPPLTVARLLPNLIGAASATQGGTSLNYTLSLHFDTITAVSGEELPEEAVQAVTFCRGNAKVTTTDDKVNITDALYIAQYLAGLRPLSDLNAVNAASPKHDTGGDKITITDALYIAQYRANLRNASFDLIS